MPRCSQLNLFVKNYFPLADFVNLEIVMMSYFHWNLVGHLVYFISIFKNFSSSNSLSVITEQVCKNIPSK